MESPQSTTTNAAMFFDMLESFPRVPIWTSLSLVLLIIYYRYSTAHFDTWRLSGVPGPRPWPLLGTTFALFTKGVWKHDLDLTEKFGRIVGTFEGRTPVLLVSDPAVLKHIMVKQFHHFIDRQASGMEPFPINKTLARLRGHHWKFVRAILSPTFAVGKIKLMMRQFNRCSSTLLQNLHKRIGEEQIPFKDYCGAFSMDVIASTLFGLHIDSQNDVNNPFVQHAKKIFSFRPTNPVVLILLVMPFMVKVLNRLRVRLSITPKESLDFFVNIIEQIIAQRKQEAFKQTDFLQLLMDAEEQQEMNGVVENNPAENNMRKGLTHEEVVAQAFMFFIAGYETTATAISFLAYNLARNQDCQHKLLQEIDSHPRQDEITYEMISKLSYLEMCIEESLRMYPPAFRVDRFCAVETVVGDLRIPQGCIVSIPVYTLNNDKQFWVEPDKYIPERFSPANKPEINAFTYLPFGMGPRSCLGMRLAITEIKVAMVHLLRDFTVHECPQSTPITFKKSFLLQTTSPVMLNLKPRDIEANGAISDHRRHRTEI